MLNTVDPIYQGKLSYLEFYYSSTSICLGASSSHNTMDPIGQHLQVAK